MFGDSFFTPQRRYSFRLTGQSFRPHVWGFFFHTVKMGIIVDTAFPFSSPCLGILFSQKIVSPVTSNVPFSFRPHVWGFFFHATVVVAIDERFPTRFSSPCLGILFSPGDVVKRKATRRSRFSSPCLGILFSLEIAPHLMHERRVKFFVPMFGDSFFTAGLGCPTGWALYGPFAAGISN